MSRRHGFDRFSPQSEYQRLEFYLHSFPAPLSVLGVVGQPPHVHVGLDDLRAKDEVLLVLPSSYGLNPAVEAERLGSELQC